MIGFIAMIQILPVVLDPMADELGVSRTAVAGASTVSTLVGAAAAFPVGVALDRHGGRALMTAGSVIGAVGVLLWSHAASLTVVYGAFVLIGMSIVMSTYEAAFAVIVVATSVEHRDRSILAVTMIAGLGTYAVYPLMGWLNATLGWRSTLIVLAAVMLSVSVPAHLFALPSGDDHRARVQHRPGSSVGAAVRSTDFWLVLVAFVAQAASVSAFLLLVVTYLRDVGHSEAVATSIPIAIGVLQVLSRLMISAFVRVLSMTVASAIAFAIQGAGLLLLPLAGLSIPLTLLCVAAVGLGQGIGVIARPSIVADSFGIARFASVLAIISVPIALARASSPLVGAWLGDWRFLVVSGAIALIGAGALLPLTRRPGPSRRTDSTSPDPTVRERTVPAG
ncbi:MFS transporter [Gordonia humi]